MSYADDLRGSAPRFTNKYYPGAHRYVYYSNKKALYYFSNTQYIKKDAIARKNASVMASVTFLLLSFMFLITLLPSLVHVPHKPSMDYDATVIIQDDARILAEDEKALINDSFQYFTDITGVAPAFVSVTDDTWAGEYSTFEEYADKMYTDMFPDEKHWLFIFCDNGGTEQDSFCTVLGNECECAITDEAKDRVEESIWQKLNSNPEYGVGNAVSEAIEENMSYIMSKTINENYVTSGYVITVFLICSIIALIFSLRIVPEKDPRIISERCPTDADKPEEATCPECGGVYVNEMRKTCPHCGKPVATGTIDSTQEE